MDLPLMLKLALECGLWTWRQYWIAHMWSQICAKIKLWMWIDDADVDCGICSLNAVVHTLLDVNMSGSKAGSHANGSNSGSNANETDKNEIVKRKILPTEKAVVCKMEKLQKEWQARVNKIKCVIIALKELMENDDNVSQGQTQLDVLMQLHGEALSLHGSLMEIVPEVEKDVVCKHQ